MIADNANISEAEEIEAVTDMDAGAVETEESVKEKKSAMARLKMFFSKKKREEQAPVVTYSALSKLTKKATAESIQKINDFLGSIEHQLDKVDEQNKTLLDQLADLKENNKSLLEQVRTLTHNNDQLTEQFNSMKRREKIAKILATISAVLAIGLSTYNILKLILQF